MPTTDKMKRQLAEWENTFANDMTNKGQRWRSSIQSARTRLGADCGSHHELLIAKFGLKLKKVEKTTRPFGMT